VSPAAAAGEPPVAYAELHCHSAFSFLDGASQPEELVAEAARLGLSGLALTDHDGMYGVVRFAEAAAEVGLPTLFGAEVALGSAPRGGGAPDPEGEHLLVLARDPEGYRRLSRAISDAHLAGRRKGRLSVDLDAFADRAGGRWQILTGCRKGGVPAALARGGAPAARSALADLVARFGRDDVAVELTDHGHPLDGERNDALAELAREARVDVVATNNVHYATPASARLAAAMAAVRARRSLDAMEGWLPAAGTAHLRSGAEMAARFARFPEAVANAARIGAACSFDLRLLTPRLPDFPVPPGHTEASWLRLLTGQGARRRYGPPDRERVAGAYTQLAHELDVIETLGFAGYFLIVNDIVAFCREKDILCQGRGSAANSAVCFALGITSVDAVSFGLLFERFLAPERDGPPDIDLDIESGRREEVIQYVYGRYGRERAAQVANVITYRPRSAVRDAARALGYSPGQQNAWSRRLSAFAAPGPPPPGVPAPRGPAPGSAGAPDGASAPAPETEAEAEEDGTGIPAEVRRLAGRLLGRPRHLGIHSGGMVICDRPVADVVPVEWARMPGRTVVQWDKDDCAAAGLVKFDLLGLGMLSMLRGAFALIRSHHGRAVDLESIPPEDPAVYDMLCAADAVGVFQVESRAQLATLPRLRPRRFYDLVVEVALIRPGPIQGGSVHPYLRRRDGTEEVAYPHPLLRRSLAKTLGVPLFQEQLMQMAVDVAGFTPAEADQLRRAMGAKRSTERIGRLRARLYAGMAANGITGEAADDLYAKLAAFADYGFPESHSASFAFLVYASAWVKLYYPAAFCAALLNAQPMGFYSPQSIVADARRHGVVVRGPDVNASGSEVRLEPDGQRFAVRLGLAGVRRLGADLARRVVEEREARGAYADMADLVRRTGVTAAQAESLATAGAFGCFGLSRRQALWAAGAVAQARPGSLEGMAVGADTDAVAPHLPGMRAAEQAAADLWATGVTPDCHPTQFIRDRLDAMGVVVAARLGEAEPNRRVLVAGVVTHRQRPATAGGTTFLSLEDETGLVNVVASRGVWARHRAQTAAAAALVVRGRLEKARGVANVIAERMWALGLAVPPQSRDYR
jgi:error-prone DNA polymerase